MAAHEKYFLNVSAAEELGVDFINIHGVYSHQRDEDPRHGKCRGAETAAAVARIARASLTPEARRRPPHNRRSLLQPR